MDLLNLYQTVYQAGGRLTKIRKMIIAVLVKNQCLLSRKSLLAKLKKAQIKPDRSTLYRELQFLIRIGLVKRNNLDGVDYYEIPQDHHHHLVCVSCNSISKVAIGNHLEKQEKQIAKQNKFNIINHSLEFYGYCQKCQA